VYAHAPCITYSRTTYELLLALHTGSLDRTPGLPTPVFVACSTNMGEGLVKLITCNDVPDVCRRVAEYSCAAASKPKNVARLLDVKRSVTPWSVFVIGSTLTCKNVPLLNLSTQHPGTSLHMISFARPSPC